MGLNSPLVVWFLCRPVDAQQNAGAICLSQYRLVYPLCQSGKIRVERTNDNAGVGRATFMQADEMLAVEREQYALLSRSKGQHFLVWYGCSGAAGLLNCQYVVT